MALPPQAIGSAPSLFHALPFFFPHRGPAFSLRLRDPPACRGTQLALGFLRSRTRGSSPFCRLACLFFVHDLGAHIVQSGKFFINCGNDGSTAHWSSSNVILIARGGARDDVPNEHANVSPVDIRPEREDTQVVCRPVRTKANALP